MTIEEQDRYRSSVADWELQRPEGQPHRLERTFTLANFGQALELVNQCGQLAEHEGHHPDLRLFDYKNLTITLYTHNIKGLSMNDFIMAAKIDELWHNLTTPA